MTGLLLILIVHGNHNWYLFRNCRKDAITARKVDLVTAKPSWHIDCRVAPFKPYRSYEFLRWILTKCFGLSGNKRVCFSRNNMHEKNYKKKFSLASPKVGWPDGVFTLGLSSVIP